MTLSDDIATFIHRSPGRSIAVMVVLTLLFGSGMYNFTMTMDVNDMLPKTDEVEQLNRIQEEFFDAELVAIVTRGEPVLSPAYFAEVSAIVEAWAGDAKVREGLAGDPLSVILTVPTTLAQYDLMSGGNPQPTLEEVLAQARSYATSQEIVDRRVQRLTRQIVQGDIHGALGPRIPGQGSVHVALTCFDLHRVLAKDRGKQALLQLQGDARLGLACS